MLLEILRCMVQIVGDRQAHENLKPGTLIKMLEICEVALRSNITVEAMKQVLEELRIGLATVVNRLLPSDAPRLAQ